MALTEEIPLYAGLIGSAYRLFGEHEWFGRAWSILATLVAMIALYDWTKQCFGRAVALRATALFSFCPLTLFYGRAFQPDASMLAGMLAALAFYRRYLDGGKRSWLLAAASAGLVGAAFKYYGLMVLVPLAGATWREKGWRACFSRPFLLLAAVLVLPIAFWIDRKSVV